jgi:2-polyprenyl-3-methyl-5-hydroxy-6-metoxy-1,4-benzoquinol methylase
MPGSRVLLSSESLVYSFCRLLWRDLGLRRIPLLRSLWAFLIRLWLIMHDKPAQDRAHFNRIYSKKADPWNYKLDVQKQRYGSALQFLAEALAGKKVSRALEIGCSEGRFTQLLAEHCDSLLAVDISSVALERARERCSELRQVQFNEWNLSKDPMPGKFHLITVMDVLEYYYAPSDLRAARDKIVEMLVPGGYLLITTSKARDFIERSIWARWLYCGTHLLDCIAQHPDLITCNTAEMEIHAQALFCKSDAGFVSNNESLLSTPI